MAKKAIAKKSASKSKTTKTHATKKDLNETGIRQSPDRRNGEKPIASERRKTQRRRQIDPTTCERDYTNDEVEFMHALDQYKRDSGRMFPTCSEILEVVRKLGYSKRESKLLANQLCQLGDGETSSIELNAIEI